MDSSIFLIILIAIFFLIIIGLIAYYLKYLRVKKEGYIWIGPPEENPFKAKGKK
ncbi:MAG: hypothetical protein N3D84_00620 [Candidatus Woesearchaeota archaeon]|nr:hypothetical protein [Candidatus Woesearchaeota archaeon]